MRVSLTPEILNRSVSINRQKSHLLEQIPLSRWVMLQCKRWSIQISQTCASPVSIVPVATVLQFRPPICLKENLHASHIFCCCFGRLIDFDLRLRLQAFQSGNKSQSHDTPALRIQWFWLLRREQIARTQMERCAQGHQELCRDGVRSRCADGFGLVALGSHQYSGRCQRNGCECRCAQQHDLAPRRGTGPYRLWCGSLGRYLPAERGQTASLYFHRVRAQDSVSYTHLTLPTNREV